MTIFYDNIFICGFKLFLQRYKVCCSLIVHTSTIYVVTNPPDRSDSDPPFPSDSDTVRDPLAHSSVLPPAPG